VLQQKNMQLDKDIWANVPSSPSESSLIMAT